MSNAILICDDEVDLGEELAELFEGRGWRAFYFQSSLMAADFLGAGLRVDCLFTDLRMPGKTGLDLAMVTAAMPENQRPSLIVFMTGQEPGLISETVPAPDMLLSKPFDPILAAEQIEHRLLNPAEPRQ